MQVVSAEFVKGLRGADEILYDGTPQIAFIGRSNVGKSSLINALVQRKTLVKTSAKPGKTVELNVFRTNTNVYLIDLPGYGYARVSPTEKDRIRAMILWYLRESKTAPLVVVVIDAKAGLTAFDEETLSILRAHKHPVVLVLNKIDRLNQKERAAQLKQARAVSHEAEIFACSALEKTGIAELAARLFS